MNITILTPIFPYPLNSGGAQAQFNMIDKIRHTHKVTLLLVQSRRLNKDDFNKLQSLWPEVEFVRYKYSRQLCNWHFLGAKIVRALNLVFRKNNERFKVERAIKPYGIYFSHDLVRFVCNTVRKSKADIVQVEFFPLLQIAKYLPNDIKKIFVHHELRFVRNERLLEGMTLTEKEKEEMETVRRDEICNLNRYDRVVTLTVKDKEVLVENGVKVDIFVSPAAVNTKVSAYHKWNGRVVFLGGYGHKPNEEGLNWFINTVVPKISWKQFPNVEFHLIGGGWPQSSIKSYTERMPVTFVYDGFMPNLENVACGSIMIIPILTGSGMRMKILEASALCLPFITTSVGVEGLQFESGDSCIIEDEADRWALALFSLMSDEDLRYRLATRAQVVFEKHYSVSALASRRMEIYK